jgi:hypothetical protein
LTPYPAGDRVALTVFDYTISGLFHGPALFLLRVHEASFDSWAETEPLPTDLQTSLV